MRSEGIELVVWIVGFLYIIGALECIIIEGIIMLWPVAFYRREGIVVYIFISQATTRF
jgi:hypothetical protein